MSKSPVSAKSPKAPKAAYVSPEATEAEKAALLNEAVTEALLNEAEQSQRDPEDDATVRDKPTEDPTEASTPVVALPSVGRFTFTMETLADIPVPKTAERTPSTLDLPFKSWFPTMKHNGHIFLPHEFWTAPKAEGGREVDPKKATSGYVRAKIRGAFNDWKAKDPETRANRELILVPRKAGDGDGKFSDGMSIFMQIVDKATVKAEG